MARMRRKLENAVWEWKLGIRTRGLYFSESSNDEFIHYGTQSYATALRVLEGLALSPGDVFVDLGCGKGRVICLASLHEVREVIGVDYSPVMCTMARSNARRVKGRRSPIRIWEGLAQDFNYSQGSVFYMFHPFGPATLGQVLDCMRRGIEAHPRPIRIAYVNPVHDSLLREVSWLEEQDRWEQGGHPDIDVPVSFWGTHGR